ncbi:hypothetical protein F6Q10_13090 [Streptomyces vinaceus]|nr:hypothetical protein [Streptomyces vinaceus]
MTASRLRSASSEDWWQARGRQNSWSHGAHVVRAARLALAEIGFLVFTLARNTLLTQGHPGTPADQPTQLSPSHPRPGPKTPCTPVPSGSADLAGQPSSLIPHLPRPPRGRSGREGPTNARDRAGHGQTHASRVNDVPGSTSVAWAVGVTP